ncbi:phage tail protein [Neolewinella agarilytica]|uniref:phage tail protein n=1 Tax=Neolewinella agarilytica TaxID=478744 RepID=UPI0023562F04|nr:tail fiber protein [Neolewinella agarilytica]
MQPFLGQIVAFGGNFAPRGWAKCEGQLLAINQNQALFSILGTTYGGDGRTTFGLPDLRGRSMVGPGTGPGLSNVRLGERGGNETTTLTQANLPSIPGPAIRLGGAVGNQSIGSDRYLAFNALGETIFTDTPPSSATLNSGSTGNIGGQHTPFSNQSPYTSVTMIIALQGVFPSRN